jgi:hypothetical protein
MGPSVLGKVIEKIRVQKEKVFRWYIASSPPTRAEMTRSRLGPAPTRGESNHPV